MRIHNNAEKLHLVQALCNAAKSLLKKNQHDKEMAAGSHSSNQAQRRVASVTAGDAS